MNPQLFRDESAPPAPPKGAVWTRLSEGKPSGARPVKTEFVYARSVDEVVGELAKGDAAIVAGGMSHAVRRERTGFPQAKRLVAIGRIPELSAWSIDGRGTLRAGAAVRQQTLYEDQRVCNNWRALGDALESAGHTRIRQMTTVGGSVAPLIGGFDLPVALLAVHGKVGVTGPQGARTMQLQALFEARLAKDELVTGIEVDALPPHVGSSFYKYLPRSVIETPAVNTAAMVRLDAAGKCADARVVVGSVSWKPVVLELPQLNGHALDPKRVRAAVQGLHALVQPVSNVRGSAAYKREMAVEFAVRALITAWQRALETQ